MKVSVDMYTLLLNSISKMIDHIDGDVVNNEQRSRRLSDKECDQLYEDIKGVLSIASRRGFGAQLWLAGVTLNTIMRSTDRRYAPKKLLQLVLENANIPRDVRLYLMPGYANNLPRLREDELLAQLDKSKREMSGLIRGHNG